MNSIYARKPTTTTYGLENIDLGPDYIRQAGSVLVRLQPGASSVLYDKYENGPALCQPILNPGNH